MEPQSRDRITAEKWQQNATPVPSVSTTTEGGPRVREIQRVVTKLVGKGMSGTFTPTFGGQTLKRSATSA